MDDTRIQSIGSLFRRLDGSQWGINVGFSPVQEKTSLTFSNAPVLARRRILNPTREYKPAGYHLRFQIQDTRSWTIKNLGDCPVLNPESLNREEAEQLCFSFRGYSGVKVWLPQFELARALFLHDAYLSRTAIESSCLENEFDITINEGLGYARINVLPSSGYPLKSFDDYGARRVLSWILVDPDARSSFESISKCQILYGEESRGYRRWCFSFEPPKLSSVKFSVRGKYDRESNSLFVYEIDSIQNISSDVPEVVEIYHPEFREHVQGDVGSRGKGHSGSPSDIDVYDGGDSSCDNERTLLKSTAVKFEFAQPFETTKIAISERRCGARLQNEEEGETERKVSTEEPTGTGNLPSADWDAVLDTTDDAHLYANKFNCFHMMINQLVKGHECSVFSKSIRKLPKVPRCKKHLLADGNPRCIAVVEIIILDEIVHILEVDTSDSVSLLSSKILLLNSLGQWSDQLIKLEGALLGHS